jgi:LysM repeat protein
MDTKDGNTKPQETGGLKLMTVFIAVLALHVVIIGSFTIYHLMSGGSSDADLAALDKTHKKDGSAVTDSSLPDALQAEKNAATISTTTADGSPAEVTTIPTTPTTTATQPTVTEVAAPAVMTPPAPTADTAPTPAPTPAPAVAATPITPAVTAPPTPIASNPTPQVSTPTQTAPISPALTPPPEPRLTLAPTLAPTPETSPLNPTNPTAALSAGPVHMPPAVAASTPVHEHGQAYTVKITDSYKKIAEAHHISVAQLKQANHIKGDTLHSGQKLIIPSASALAAEPATTSTHLDATPVRPMLTNSVSTHIATTGSSHHEYTIMKGDTLIKIAHKFKTTPSAIMEANSISDPTRLTIGKKLKIPGQESRSARNTPAPMEKPNRVFPTATAVQPAAMQPAPSTIQPITPQPSQVESTPPPQQQGDTSGHLANFVP